MNIFFFKEISKNQIHISRENLFQKIQFTNYKRTEDNKGYLHYNFTAKGVEGFKSERWKEYKSFAKKFYQKNLLQKKNIEYKNFYHNFYFTEIAYLGMPEIFLLIYIFFLKLKYLYGSFKLKKRG